ncbi:MAG: phospho-sugar mutase [Planctomycetaceae bacterium]|jgi:phosphomannomutase|nr:phospho-sugar mutase [Planctomycetaceae bacterium]MBT4724791.1 phospho-sugar mutase [Planctomycetaceae bacterium]MBT4844662.1 phospho-sugar mutase [Planctomycetaceae bacterium]MBT5124231.1 phospho-sugar mutase [Planctomycetaceae bacterium]MBT5599904.1 phospho-sugar mutase [Planctomycetaceae bacterium]
MDQPDKIDITELVNRSQAAAHAGLLSDSALNNLTLWLTQSRYAEYVSGIGKAIGEESWQELDDVFWRVIPFGTGGRRGRMHPFGSNVINDRTIGESAQGLAKYVLNTSATQSTVNVRLSCAIGYDTRHQSRHFAELCAGIMVANGFHVYFLDEYRATPQVSFLVRQKKCACGIMVTASHNPPSDNAVKIYWNDGGQILPPHDVGIIEQVMEHVDNIKACDFDEAVRSGDVTICTAEIDELYRSAVVEHCIPPRLSSDSQTARGLKVIYSPLHGVGGFVVPAILQACQFDNVVVFPDHAEPDPNFTNVPNHVSNPENPAVFDLIIKYAQQEGADIVLATDPDADRMGCAAPVSLSRESEWKTFNGNQLCAMLAAYRMQSLQDQDLLTSTSFQVTTLVTTSLLRRIGEHYGIQTRDDLLVGFKWIASAIDEGGANDFIYGTEESHGFMVGDYCRDKDGAAACMLVCELADDLKQQGKTLHDFLASLYKQFGVYQESLKTIYMPGSSGMQRMQHVMDQLRNVSPRELGGLQVMKMRDYLTHQITTAAGVTVFPGPTDNLLFFELSTAGHYVAIRPSGTEPKIKFYTFTRADIETGHSVEKTQAILNAVIQLIENDLQRFVDAE